MKVTKIIFTAIIVLSVSVVYSQSGRKPFSSAIGGRIEVQGAAAPNESNLFLGGAYKHYLDFKKSFEIIGLTDLDRGAELYALFQYNGKIPDMPANVRWILGGGFHLGTWSGDSFVTGIDGQLGLEYTFSSIPVSISADWHPVLNFVTTNDNLFWPLKFGVVNVKYTIK